MLKIHATGARGLVGSLLSVRGHGIVSRVMTLSGSELAERLRAVRLLCLDVDGVLTDGHLYWSDGGGWSQRFCVQDGFGIKLVQELGIEVAILSGGDIRSARARAESLRIRHAYFGLVDKVAAYEALAQKLGVTAAETAYVGDELVDVPLLCQVGFGATVPDAVEEVHEAARYVTRRPGGHGAVREVCDLIRRHSAVALGRTAAASPLPIPAGAGQPASESGSR
jgi:3-deoxy-D-manno-octulosonate 8-phosphate phosphatase (KDO 8-P phosphatase)